MNNTIAKYLCVDVIRKKSADTMENIEEESVAGRHD